VDDSRINASTDGAGGSRLTIRDAKPGDAALYSCVATNPHGLAKSAATLHVSGQYHQPKLIQNRPVNQFIYKNPFIKI